MYKAKFTTEMPEDVVVEVKSATVRFNMSSQKVDNLKEYVIKTLRHELMFQEFLALQDIDLTIKKGESWGFIGANGAGKSTLLKLICGIFKPYRGTVRTRGSIAPLIELGAGFNPELTASENIYLNGAVMGHSKKFMKAHFDEIVDFAELWGFLDMPIKNYSSGMAARLGFSVATIVHPDILIADEVLAVGDYAFAQKCKQRMNELLADGTTLLFVSHDIDTVKSLCNKAIWLDHGKTVMAGESQPICDAYYKSQGGTC